MKHEEWEVPRWMVFGDTDPPGFPAYCWLFHAMPDGRPWTDALEDAGIAFDPKLSYWDLLQSADGDRVPWNEVGELPERQLAGLIERLRAWSPNYHWCHAYYGSPPVGFNAPEEPTWNLELPAVQELTQYMSSNSPTYLFDASFRWCLHTHCDANETILAGPQDLIGSVIATAGLDAYPYTPREKWRDGSRTIWVEPDYSVSGLWERVAGEGRPADPRCLPLSEDVRGRLRQWLLRFESGYDPNECAFRTQEETEAFEREQWDIWRRVREELPPVFDVGNVLLYDREYFGAAAEEGYRLACRQAD